MPLVLTQSGNVFPVRNEDVLAEILGHSDFDGEPWAIGDRLFFEDGTESTIKLEPDDHFHVWDDPTPADFDEARQALGVPEVTDWDALFAHFDGPPPPSGCLASTAAILLLGVVFS